MQNVSKGDNRKIRYHNEQRDKESAMMQPDLLAGVLFSECDEVANWGAGVGK